MTPTWPLHSLGSTSAAIAGRHGENVRGLRERHRSDRSLTRRSPRQSQPSTSAGLSFEITLDEWLALARRIRTEHDPRSRHRRRSGDGADGGGTVLVVCLSDPQANRVHGCHDIGRSPGHEPCATSSTRLRSAGIGRAPCTASSSWADWRLRHGHPQGPSACPGCHPVNKHRLRRSPMVASVA